MLIVSKYPGSCLTCNREVRIGDRVSWLKGRKGVEHAACSAEGREIAEKSAASKAVDVAPEIAAELPVPDGLSYLGYQKAGIAYALAHEGTLLADQMGLGKSIQAIGVINASPDVHRVLIVCPASLKLNWRNECRKWLTRPMTIGVRPYLREVSAEIEIINYDILKKLPKNATWDLLVLDESHYVKNPKAARSKHVKELRKRCTRVLALTGTPILNKPIELWPVLQIVAPEVWDPPGFVKGRNVAAGEGAGFFRFAKRYCNPPEAPIWMGDFSFKKLGDVQIGDTIIGWKRTVGPRAKKNLNGRASLSTATVTAIHRHHAPIVRVTLRSGKTIRCTADHRWLSGKSSHFHGAEVFITPRVGRALVSVIEPTPALPTELIQDAAWLGGMFDGEGTYPRIAQSPTANPELYAELQKVLTRLDLPFTPVIDGIQLTGGREAAIKFVTWCKPRKTSSWIDRHILSGRFKGNPLKGSAKIDEIVSIEPDGQGEVIGLTTTTGNYVAWGYASKNCDAKQVWHSAREAHWDFNGASNLPELQEKLRASCMVRRLKADVLKELPAKRRQTIEIEVDGAEVEEFDTMHPGEDWRDGSWDGFSLVEAKRRVQFTEISSTRKANALRKVPAVVEHVTDAFESSDKIILFAHHREVIAALTDQLAQFNPVVITGETPIDVRQANVETFQKDPTCRLIIGSIGAMGVGLTLTASSHVIFAELDWTPANVTQAEDRAHRIGQRESVLVQHLVLKGSLDARMIELLIRKQEIADLALDEETLDDVSDRAIVEAKPTVSDELMAEALKVSALVHMQLRYLAACCDGAQAKDGSGFNKLDAPIGKRLAARDALTPRQTLLGQKIVMKYRRQLEGLSL